MRLVILRKLIILSVYISALFFGITVMDRIDTGTTTEIGVAETMPYGPQVPLTFEEELQQAISNTSGYNRTIKLVPYSAYV